MNRWAIELGSDGKGHQVDPAAACAARETPALFVWVHMDGREGETLGWLKEHAGLPDSVIYALTATETRPRCEAIGDGALINLRGPVAAEQETPDRLASIRIWAERGRTISVSFVPIDGIDAFQERMAAGMVKDPGDLVAGIAVAITKKLDPVITDLGDLVDDCETALEPEHAFETRRKIAEARSDAIVYRRFVAPQREALTALAQLDVDWLEDDDRLHLRDAADRFARMTEELEAVRERSALIHEQLTDLRAEQIEHRGLLLSIVALIFLPLTFLTGLLGMNVEGIPYAKEPWAFDAVCILCVIVSVLIAGWFAAQHWFRN
jgi:zinc transporter